MMKDEYRPNVLPPPPVGKSTGHGVVHKKEFTIEDPTSGRHNIQWKINDWIVLFNYVEEILVEWSCY